MSSNESRIDGLLAKLRSDSSRHSAMQNSIPTSPPMNTPAKNSPTPQRPKLFSGLSGSTQPRPRPHNLPFTPKKHETQETDEKLKKIMMISGKLKINNVEYNTQMTDMEFIEELGNGTCGHVVKMLHKPSDKIIAVKQMRRSGNSEENKRIVMDIEVVLESHDCEYIVECLGCFITKSEVWICMELMSTCFDKLLKKLKKPIPEHVLGKVTLATVKALSYLKEKRGVIHRDVKPSNILLDERGNVKLCDFGISGRLVDSMAKTRSAGCAAYMAPERIEPSDPNNPEYDIRADVWSLGITLVELATGEFPYKGCQTDFEVLTTVIKEDPPKLPETVDFSGDFRQFVSCCLTKDQKHRPKYKELLNEPFIKKYEKVEVNVGHWFRVSIDQVDTSAKSQSSRQTPPPVVTSRRPPPTHRSLDVTSPNKLTNGSSKPMFSPSDSADTTEKSPESHPTPSLPPDGRSLHNSRLTIFQNSASAAYQRDRSPYNLNQNPSDRFGSFNNDSSNTYRSFSPFQAYQNHIQANRMQSTGDGIKENIFTSPLPQRRAPDSNPGSVLNSPFFQRRVNADNKWPSPKGSPLPLRNNFQEEHQMPYNPGNTSPIVLQRFYHQQKQQQQQKEAEEAAKNEIGKKRFASYIKLQLGGERSGRSSRHQSPEPPPRHNRSASSDNQSPLALHRTYFEGASQGSPSLSRRYISPTPPVPPPRRLSESTSVPGSPQHLRASFRYTPEPQRRLFQNSDVPS